MNKSLIHYTHYHADTGTLFVEGLCERCGRPVTLCDSLKLSQHPPSSWVLEMVAKLPPEIFWDDDFDGAVCSRADCATSVVQDEPHCPHCKSWLTPEFRIEAFTESPWFTLDKHDEVVLVGTDAVRFDRLNLNELGVCPECTYEGPLTDWGYSNG